MVADGELEANAIDQLPLHNTNLDCSEKAGAYLELYSFIFVLCKLFHLGPLLDHGNWQLFQSCNSCAATFPAET